MLIIFYLILFFFGIRLLVLWLKNRSEERLAQAMEKEKISSKMDANKFWEIIERAKATSAKAGSEKLKDELRKLTAREVVEFENRFWVFKNKAYRWDLWGAVYLLNGGCGDDSFDYFRGWMIGQGKEKFEQALKDPQCIKDFFAPEEEWEAINTCATMVYVEKSGKKMMPSDVKVKEEPVGREWEEEELAGMFPGLVRKEN